MLNRTIETSTQLFARIAGFLYLLLIALGGIGEYIRNKVVIPGDAVATAANLSSMETLWRVGATAEFLALICALGMAMIYYYLLRPVSKELNVLATLLRVVASAVQAVAVLSLVAALFPLGDAAYLKAFTPDQLGALARLAIRWHAYGYSLALFFFGSCFLVHGRLIFKSGFLPKTLGILIQVAGVCYVTNSLLLFLAPDIAGQVFPAILLPCFVAELSLCAWLIVKGVNVERWREKAGVLINSQKTDGE